MSAEGEAALGPVEDAPETTGVHLAARIKPAESEDAKRAAPVVACDAKGKVRIRNELRNRTNEYTVDHAFDASANEELVFDSVGRPLVQHVVAGGNAALVCYGAAESGKSHTALGVRGSNDPAHRGVLPRAAEAIFDAVAAGNVPNRVCLSVVDVYVSQARDFGKFVLAPPPPPEPAAGGTGAAHARKARARAAPGLAAIPTLAADEGANGEFDVTPYKHHVDSADELVAAVKKCLNRRAALSGGVSQAKRAHTVVSVHVPSKKTGNEAVLSVVVCGGSERLDFISDPVMLRERGSINSGLHCLQQVCFAISRGRGEQHVPYRSSMLTKVLYQSMRSKNCKLFVVAHVRQERELYDESLLSLQYVAKCKYNAEVEKEATTKIGAPLPRPDSAPALDRPMAKAQPVRASDGLSTVEVHDKDAVIQRLEVQVSTLAYNLEVVHGHYQKLLERVGGREYVKNLGVAEKPKLPDLMEDSKDSSAGSQNGPAPSRQVSMAGGIAMGTTEKMLQMRRMETELNETSIERDNLKSRVKKMEEDLQISHDATEKLQKHIEIMERKLNDQNRQDRKNKQREVQMIKLQATRATQELQVHLEEITTNLGKERTDKADLRQELLAISSTLPKKVENAFAEKEVIDMATKKAETMVKNELMNQMRAAADDKYRSLKNIRDQATYFVEEERKHRIASARQLQKYRESTDATLASLREENQALWEYAAGITRVVERLEGGHYGMRERSGLKSFVIPSWEKPSMSTEKRKATLRMLMNGMAKVDVVELTNEAHEKARREAEVAAMTEADLREEVNRLKEELARAAVAHKELVLAEEKVALAHEVENELASDSTVEYIRQLEKDNREKTQQLVAERKSMQLMRIALDASNRRLESARKSRLNPAAAPRSPPAHRPSTASPAGVYRRP